jgi:glyoxylase-like metal-dependent hydrolase (beta-lactamase superfamily II)
MRPGTARLLGASVAFVLLFVAFRSTAQQEADSPVRQLAPGVFYWQGNRERQVQTNVGWVIFRDYVLVIDANFPWGAREILPAIRKTTDKPIRFVFDTHYHADHAYGNVVFSEIGATVVCSRDCTQESRSKGQRDVQNQAKERATDRLVHPSLLFDDKLTFDDGEKRVELIKVGPAHTKGDSVAYLPKEKILFVGDLAVNWTLGNNLSDVDADHRNWVRVLDQLARWDANIVAPGHGVLGNLETIRGQRDYLADMLRQVEAGIQAGKSVETLAEEINLTRYQPFGAEPRRTAGQVRSMYRKLAANELRK